MIGLILLHFQHKLSALNVSINIYGNHMTTRRPVLTGFNNVAWNIYLGTNIKNMKLIFRLVILKTGCKYSAANSLSLFSQNVKVIYELKPS